MRPGADISRTIHIMVSLVGKPDPGELPSNLKEWFRFAQPMRQPSNPYDIMAENWTILWRLGTRDWPEGTWCGWISWSSEYSNASRPHFQVVYDRLVLFACGVVFLIISLRRFILYICTLIH